MAAIESKRSLSTAQGRGRAHAATKPHTATKSVVTTRKRRFPTLPKPIFRKRKRWKTTRRHLGSTFYHFDKVRGKTVDFVEFFTMGEYHSIDIHFQDKTMFHCIIEPGFTLETEYSTIKTGNWRCIKKWPLIRSAPFNS